MPVRPSLLTFLVPALAVAGDSLPQIAPTPAKPPKATADTFYLVDKVIPAYGMRYLPYEHGDRAQALVNDIKAFVAEVDSKVMEGTLRRTAPPVAPVDAKTPKDQPAPPAAPGVRAPLPEEVTLNDLLGRLVVLEQRLKASRPAELPIPEQWTIDGALSDLHRAADTLRLGLNDSTYTNLEAQQRAWLLAWLAYAGQAREQKIAELMAANKKLSRKDAEAQLEKTNWKPPHPAAGQVVAAPGAVAPKDAAPAPGAKPAPAPEAAPAAPAPEAKPAEPAPEAKPAEPPAPAPAPEPEAKPSEPPPAPAPAPEPEAKPAEPPPAPAPEPEAKPAEPPAPAPEAKPAEPPAPAPAEPAPEAKPAEPPAPAPAEPAPEAKPAEPPAPAPAEPPAPAPEAKPEPKLPDL